MRQLDLLLAAVLLLQNQREEKNVKSVICALTVLPLTSHVPQGPNVDAGAFV